MTTDETFEDYVERMFVDDMHGTAWRGDLLERRRFAATLTEYVKGREAPCVIALNGGWGTGKTFFLKNWRNDLNEGAGDARCAVYFNAWEDDFCDDPLVAIVGRLSEEFGAAPYESVVQKIRENAKPLLKKLSFVVANELTRVDLEKLVSAIRPAFANEALDNYGKQRETKRQLQESLRELAQKVKIESGKPLVFIIDELDRCRPLFAIELLERIKHIFGVENAVFVLGINRVELCRSIRSVYGDIDASTYLQRFFTAEYSFEEYDSVRFCEGICGEFNLLSNHPKTLVRAGRRPGEFSDYYRLMKLLIKYCGYLQLSLRDVQHCFRCFVSVVAQHRDAYAIAELIVPLVILRLKNPILYQEFRGGICYAGKVVDWLDASVRRGDGAAFTDRNDARSKADVFLERVEEILYRQDDSGYPDGENRYLEAFRSFGVLGKNPLLKYLSTRAREDNRVADRLRDVLGRRDEKITRETFELVFNLVENTNSGN